MSIRDDRRPPPRRRAAVPGTALAALALLALGCDGGSSPTAPDVPASTVDVVVDDPTGALAVHVPLIRQLLATTFDRASRRISVGGTTITVRATAAGIIPGWGLGGFTFGPSDVELRIDPAYPGLEFALADRLPPLAAHELHHAARLRGLAVHTLLDALVLEGLADHFAIELLGSPVPPWASALSPADVERYLRLAEAEFDELNDPGRWFFAADPEIPMWTGYTLGFHLVGEHIARTGRSAAELVHAPAGDFRPRGG